MKPPTHIVVYFYVAKVQQPKMTANDILATQQIIQYLDYSILYSRKIKLRKDIF